MTDNCREDTEKVPILVYEKSTDKVGDHGEITKSQDEPSKQGRRSKGLSVALGVLFVLGETAGSGVMALPYAMGATGYSGVILIIVGGLVTMYTSILLGRCWLTIRDHHAVYRCHVRHPYAVIGQITYGTPGRMVVSFCGNIHLFFVTVVFLVMASQNVESLLQNIFGVHLSFCYIQLILAAILLPLTWLESPKDMWLVGTGAGVSTLIAVCFLLYIIARDGQRMDTVEAVPANTKSQDWLGVVQSIGVIEFAYGGHSGYPVIHNDMKVPTKWTSVSVIAFLIMIIIYALVGLAGYVVYGAGVNGNVLLSASPGPATYLVQVLITVHLLCGFVIVLNPVMQEIEQLMKMRTEFSWRRIVSHSTVVLASLFLAQSVPKFGALVALVGGIGATSLSFVGPPLLYLRVRKIMGDANSLSLPIHIKTLLIEIAVVSLVLGVLATITALVVLFSPGSFTLPCYVNVQTAGQ